MKNLLIILFVSLIAVRCTNNTRVHQKLEDIKIAISCPCELKVDSNTIKYWQQSDSMKVAAYLCYDSTNNDTYKITLGPEKDSIYTTQQFVDFFTTDMDTSGIISNYEVMNIDGDTAIIMRHKNRSRMDMQLFRKDAGLYIIVRADDSLEDKFNEFVGSMINLEGYHNNGAL